jgi:hypothetical protein
MANLLFFYLVLKHYIYLGRFCFQRLCNRIETTGGSTRIVARLGEMTLWSYPWISWQEELLWATGVTVKFMVHENGFLFLEAGKVLAPVFFLSNSSLLSKEGSFHGLVQFQNIPSTEECLLSTRPLLSYEHLPLLHPCRGRWSLPVLLSLLGQTFCHSHFLSFFSFFFLTSRCRQSHITG